MNEEKEIHIYFLMLQINMGQFKANQDISLKSIVKFIKQTDRQERELIKIQ